MYETCDHNANGSEQGEADIAHGVGNSGAHLEFQFSGGRDKRMEG